MTHQEQAEAYNMGWNMVRNPTDKHFQVAAPKQKELADEFYRGWDDGRRSMMGPKS